MSTKTFKPKGSLETKFTTKTNKFLTSSLFFESPQMERHNREPIYTVKDKDYAGYISLYDRYLEMEDQTEFEFANKYFASYRHWLVVANTNWIKPHVNRWRYELELKLKARSLGIIRDLSMSEQPSVSLQANKYLLEKKWEGSSAKDISKKESNLSKSNEQEKEIAIVDEAYERLMN